MFWTKAIPTEQMSAEHIRRNFGVIEAPDSAIYLASVMNILSLGLGYKTSAEQRACVLGDGRPIPMMSYGLVEYLLGLDLTAFELLELGGGSSTPFWASRGRSVLSLETNAEWLQLLKSRRLPNLDARLSTPEALPADMLGLGRKFDAIVIDAAANRLLLARSAVQILRPGGFIILDNSDWYPNAARLLRDADLIQIDFHDFRPLHHFRCTTSLFLHPAFRAKPQAARLPLVPIGGKDVAATNGWDQQPADQMPRDQTPPEQTPPDQAQPA
jgi:SAM-dependent methyltransferase